MPVHFGMDFYDFRVTSYGGVRIDVFWWGRCWRGGGAGEGLRVGAGDGKGARGGEQTLQVYSTMMEL